MSTVTRDEALAIAARSLAAAKQAKALGQDVKEARRLMRGCRDAFESGDYAKAVGFAEEVLRICGGETPQRP